MHDVLTIAFGVAIGKLLYDVGVFAVFLLLVGDKVKPPTEPGK